MYQTHVFLRHFNVLPSDVQMYFYVVEMKCTARCFGFLAFDCGICLQSDRPSIYTCTSTKTNTNTLLLTQTQIQNKLEPYTPTKPFLSKSHKQTYLKGNECMQLET